jgi:3-hydroxyisobutyrate dehydrogenase-like beta-hydroxyacid dehydrogenase
MSHAFRSGNDKVIGILHPGEMGSSLGGQLAGAGFRVVCALEGRGERTSRLCHQAGLEATGSVREVIRESDVIISLVAPSSALSVARHYCEIAREGPEHQVFIDCNSISPETIAGIDSIVTAQNRSFVDGAILGLASRLRDRGVLLLSGARAREIAELFGGAVKVKLLGDEAGRASAYKMMMSGVSKGIAALFVELSVAADKQGLLDDLLAGMKEVYPGLMELIERLLPTYPQHARRRGSEMEELERTLVSLGLEPRMIREARRTTVEIGSLDLARPGGWTARDVIEAINSHNLFRPISNGK